MSNNENQIANSPITQHKDSNYSEECIAKFGGETIIDKSNEDDYGDYLIREMRYRFIILLTIGFLSIVSGMHMIFFSAINTSFLKNYNLTKFEVDLFTNLFFILYPFANFPSSYLIDQKGIQNSIRIGAVLTVIGALLKTFLNSHILFAYFGQAIISIAQPYIINTFARAVSLWFRLERRVAATTFLFSTLIIGIIVGYGLPQLYYDDIDNIVEDEYKDITEKYLRDILFVTLGVCVLSIILIKEKPKVPPSISQSTRYKLTFTQSLRLLFKNKEFLKLLISLSLIFGSFNVYLVITNSYFSYHNLSTDEISTISMFSYTAGIIGAILFSYLADKYKRYKLILVILTACVVVIQLVMTVLMEIFNSHAFYFYLVLVCYTMFGLTSLPIISVGVDCVSETTYPIGESVSFGIVVSFSRIIGLLTTFVFEIIITNSKLNEFDYLPNSLMCLYSAIALLCFCLINGISKHLINLEKYYRQKEDRNPKFRESKADSSFIVKDNI